MQSSLPPLLPPLYLRLPTAHARPLRQGPRTTLPAELLSLLPSTPLVCQYVNRAGYLPPSVFSTPLPHPPFQSQHPNPQQNRRLSDLSSLHHNPQWPRLPPSRSARTRPQTLSASSHLCVSCSPSGPSSGTPGDLYQFGPVILIRNQKLRWGLSRLLRKLSGLREASTWTMTVARKVSSSGGNTNKGSGGSWRSTTYTQNRYSRLLRTQVTTH